jgi:hypothetical protein
VDHPGFHTPILSIGNTTGPGQLVAPGGQYGSVDSGQPGSPGVHVVVHAGSIPGIHFVTGGSVITQ